MEIYSKNNKNVSSKRAKMLKVSNLRFTDVNNLLPKPKIIIYKSKLNSSSTVQFLF